MRYGEGIVLSTISGNAGLVGDVGDRPNIERVRAWDCPTVSA